MRNLMKVEGEEHVIAAMENMQRTTSRPRTVYSSFLASMGPWRTAFDAGDIGAAIEAGRKWTDARSSTRATKTIQHNLKALESLYPLPSVTFDILKPFILRALVACHGADSLKDVALTHEAVSDAANALNDEEADASAPLLAVAVRRLLKATSSFYSSTATSKDKSKQSSGAASNGTASQKTERGPRQRHAHRGGRRVQEQRSKQRSSE